MKKKKYYVVWHGRQTGIFDSWEDCSKSITGFKKAKYKSFPSRELAEIAFLNDYSDFAGKDTTKLQVSDLEKQLVGEPIMESIAVDAAWNTVTKDVEYRGVDTATGREIFKEGPFKDGTNNVGEFLALVHGISWMKREGIDLPIYSDSRTALVWVKNKKVNSGLEKSENNEKLLKLIDRAENWLKNNTYNTEILKWETSIWGEIPADFGRK